MPDEALMEVIHYIQFLKLTSEKMLAVKIDTSNDRKKIFRKPGIYKNRLKISDNFDEPL